MKRIIFVVLLFSCWGSARAQKVNFGPVFGVPITDVYTGLTVKKAMGERAGFTGGAFITFTYKEAFMYQQRVLLRYRAFNYRARFLTLKDSADVSANLRTLEIPFLFGTSIVRRDKFNFYFNMGPVVNIVLGSEANVQDAVQKAVQQDTSLKKYLPIAPNQILGSPFFYWFSNVAWN